MKAACFLILVLFIINHSGLAQKNFSPAFEKECRISGGGGIGGGTENAKTGTDLWLQMSYRLSKLFSIGTEFQYLYFERPNYFTTPPNSLLNREIYDNYVSFLIKCHLPIKTKLQFNVVSGWTYHILQESYSYYENTATSQHLVEARTHYSNFAIPFIAEIYYPLGNIFQVGFRGKYNLNANGDDNTYAAGVGLSIKL